ncbi:helix-turn-helix transcriptional regulator [Streptomyces morookaense]|uniref:helix-turn-helix domain-containing protein n=1 Tax=Streptomyces morookaense TaxID=1970 RepID=UPI0033EA8586
MAESIGDRIGRVRRRRGMTQEQLAEASGVSVATIRKLERNDRDSARMSTLRQLAQALGVKTTDLMQTGPIAPPVAPEADPAGILAVRRVITPARGLGRVVLADDTADAPTLTGLRASLHEGNRLYQGDNYAATVEALPSLLTEAAQLAELSDGDAWLAALEVQAQAYQLAGSTLIHLRHDDLAYQALSRAIDLAEQSGNQVLAASAVVSLCWLLLRQRRFDEAEQVAVATADAIEPSFRHSTAGHLGTWGWLLLRASAAAVRNNRGPEAADLTRQAKAAAVLVGREVIDYHEYWTTFGPTTVAMKEVENAMVQREYSKALVLSAQVVMPRRSTSNNRNRHLLDLAAAHSEQRNHAQAVEILTGIKHAAPEWLRYQRYARDITVTLVTRRKRGLSPQLARLADFLAVEV